MLHQGGGLIILHCLQVQAALDQEDSGIHPCIIVACFFVQEGADIHLTNKNGLTPLQVCSESPEIIAKVLEFAEKHTGLVVFKHAAIHFQHARSFGLYVVFSSSGTFRGSLHSTATKSPTPGQPTCTDGTAQAVQTKQVEVIKIQFLQINVITYL